MARRLGARRGAARPPGDALAFELDRHIFYLFGQIYGRRDQQLAKSLRPFGLSVPNHKRYVLLYAPGALSHPGVRAVHDWLVEEAGIFRSLHPLNDGQL